MASTKAARAPAPRARGLMMGSVRPAARYSWMRARHSAAVPTTPTAPAMASGTARGAVAIPRVPGRLDGARRLGEACLREQAVIAREEARVPGDGGGHPVEGFRSAL